MTRFCWWVGPALYRIPALSRTEAESILCHILGVPTLPEIAEYVGTLDFPA